MSNVIFLIVFFSLSSTNIEAAFTTMLSDVGDASARRHRVFNISNLFQSCFLLCFYLSVNFFLIFFLLFQNSRTFSNTSNLGGFSKTSDKEWMWCSAIYPAVSLVAKPLTDLKYQKSTKSSDGLQKTDLKSMAINLSRYGIQLNTKEFSL